MKKKPASKSAFFNPRVLIGLAFCSIGLLLALLISALSPGGNALAKGPQQDGFYPPLPNAATTQQDGFYPPLPVAGAPEQASPTPTPCFGIAFAENFDGVVAPALPINWVASNAAGAAPLWVTSTATPDTAPNDAFVDDPAIVSDKRLDTPCLTTNSGLAQISFRHSYDLEGTLVGGPWYDGGVLEVSSPNINGGTFTDITNAAVGGSFASGGYNGAISTSFASPLSGRMAWSGAPVGYISTVANLGPNVVGQIFKLRFRMGSDNSVSHTGWRVDTITSTAVCMAVCPTPTPTPTPSGTITPSPTPTATSTATATATSTPTATAAATSTPSPGCSNYVISNASGTIVPGTADIGNHTDDGSTVIALPFPVKLYGNTYTSATAGSNGFLSFNLFTDFMYTGCLPNASFSYTIFPFEIDQVTAAVGKGIFTVTTGVTPNRTFYIEWRNCRYATATTCLASSDNNYEIVFQEGVSDFSIIYGTFGAANTIAGSGAIGVQGATTLIVSQSQCGSGAPAATQQNYTLRYRNAHTNGNPNPNPNTNANPNSHASYGVPLRKGLTS